AACEHEQSNPHLITPRRSSDLEAHVADALEKGARVAAGGRRHTLGGTFYEPTLLLDAAPTMRLAREETFGPVAPLFRFSTEAERSEEHTPELQSREKLVRRLLL